MQQKEGQVTGGRHSTPRAAHSEASQVSEGEWIRDV